MGKEAFWVVEGLSEVSKAGLFHSKVPLLFGQWFLVVACNTCFFAQFIELSDVLGFLGLFVVLLVFLIFDLSANVLLEVGVLNFDPLISVEFGGFKGKLNFICSKFTILAESVEADNELNILGLEIGW
jgi:hypothetical protein